MTLLVVLAGWVLGACAFATLLGALFQFARDPEPDLPPAVEAPPLPSPRAHADEAVPVH